MEFKRAICPSCGGNLQLPPDRKTASCLYCGGELIVQDAINAAARQAVPNLLSLANAARQAGNLEEAYRYYTQALEHDANETQAWFGKAITAGSMSTVETSRIPEMIIGMQNALRVTPDNDKDLLRQQISAEVVQVADRYHHFCRIHRDKTFAWANYLNQSSEVLKALDFAYNLAPEKRAIAKRIVDILEENRSGYSSKRLGVSSAFLMEREGWLKSYRERLRELTPAQAPAKATNVGFSISPEVLKVVGILAAVLFGGSILLVVLVAIAGTVTPPPAATEPTKTAQSPVIPVNTEPKAPSPTEIISNARAILGNSNASEDQIRGVSNSLKSIAKGSKDYSQAAALIKQTESRLAAMRQMQEIEENPLVLENSRWEKGGFGVVGVWKTTLRNRSDKPVGNLGYKTTYFSETNNEVDSNSGLIQKVIAPRQKRTIEVNDGFISNEAHTANFVLTGWEYVR